QPKVDDPESLFVARVDGHAVSERIQAAIAKLGENVVVKRVGRLAVDGGVVGGYVHAGGKLGVLVALASAERGGEVPTLARDVAGGVADRAGGPTRVTGFRRFKLGEAAGA